MPISTIVTANFKDELVTLHLVISYLMCATDRVANIVIQKYGTALSLPSPPYPLSLPFFPFPSHPSPFSPLLIPPFPSSPSPPSLSLPTPFFTPSPFSSSLLGPYPCPLNPARQSHHPKKIGKIFFGQKSCKIWTTDDRSQCSTVVRNTVVRAV